MSNFRMIGQPSFLRGKVEKGWAMVRDTTATTLADVCVDVAYGYTASAVAEPVGPHFLRITDIQNGTVDWNTVPYCDVSDTDQKKYRLDRGDIVVARTGNSTGENYIYDSDIPSVFASYLIRFKIDREAADPHFVWYSMRTPKWWSFIEGSKTGSAQAGANAKVLGRFPLDLPPLEQQRAIVDILGSLDDKIELNRRMNRTLEAMARAIFKSWFIDFDPVRAKVDGNDPPGLDPATAALFPDAFQDSPLGPIPQGWEVLQVGDLCEFAYGKPLKAADRRGGPYPVFGSNGIVGWHDEALVAGPCIVIGRKGNPGTVTWTERDFFPIDTTFFVRISGHPNLLPYLQFAFETLNLPGLSADSAVPGLNRNMAYRSPLLLPPLALLNAFAEHRRPMQSRTLNNEFESTTLADVRDALLPKLLSGELRPAKPREALI